MFCSDCLPLFEVKLANEVYTLNLRGHVYIYNQSSQFVRMERYKSQPGKLFAKLHDVLWFFCIKGISAVLPFPRRCYRCDYMGKACVLLGNDEDWLLLYATRPHLAPLLSRSLNILKCTWCACDRQLQLIVLALCPPEALKVYCIYNKKRASRGERTFYMRDKPSCCFPMSLRELNVKGGFSKPSNPIHNSENCIPLRIYANRLLKYSLVQTK